MKSTSLFPETFSSSRTNQHPKVKEEIDTDSIELAIKVECEDIEVVIKVEDEEKPTVCQCEECGSGGRGRVDRCTRAMDWGQAIKKEESKGDDEQQSDETRRGKKAKWDEMVKKEVKEEEDEANMAGPWTQRCVSASADSVILKFEDEEVTCPCEDCGLVKTEEGGEEIKDEGEGTSGVVTGHRVEEEVAVEGGGSEDEEDWLSSTESSLGSLSEEEEETEDGSTKLVQGPIETGSSTAPLEVRPVAGADIEQARNARGRKLHRCPQCQKMVTSLTRHRLTHTGERPHICDQCGRAFALKGQLKVHLLTHTGEKAFSCQQCGKCFTKKADLIRHLIIHTGEKTFTCDQCGKCFAQKGQLTVHLKRHDGRKAHQCDQCQSAFVSRSELRTHRRSKHTGERPYRCHIANCNKAFADQSNLRTHLKFHIGDRRYHCEDCEMRFVTSSDLTTHRRFKHSSERLYSCHIANCNKAFADQSNLNIHLKYHNGMKKHRCEDCEMRFVTSSQLTIHRRRKHSTERLHRCPHSGCNYAAATKDDLNKHLNRKKHRQ